MTLVNTVHAECGAVTTGALVTLLERLAPDIIFAEIPAANAASYRDGSHGSLESRAIADFRQQRLVEIVAVDRAAPTEEFWRVTRAVFELVERVSRDYRNLVDLHSARIARQGLRYLNGKESAQASLAIRKEIRDTIDWTGASHLHADYDRWLHEIELRDLEMLANIEEYASESELPSGVFLVGAAHRQSIVEKALSGRSVGRSNIEWQCDLPSELFD